MEEKSIATVNFSAPAEVGLMSFDAEEFAGIELDFPRVKIPAGGGSVFELINPDDPSDPLVKKALEGVIVFQHHTNAYWESEADGSNNPPDCASDDNETGYGKPGGSCRKCPLNQFGSGEGGIGKACKNMHSIYILQDGAPLPVMLTLPPTSLKPFREYANALMFGGRLLSGVKTQVTLKKQEAGGNAYSVAVFKSTGALAPEDAKATKEYAKAFRAMVKEMQAARRAQAPAAPQAFDPETGEIDEEY